MKDKFLIIIIILTSFFYFSFNSTKNKIDKSKTFFNNLDSIKLISYANRENWDLDISINKEINIPKEKIIDNLIVSKIHFKKIIKIFNKDYKNFSLASCYSPRHLFEFYKNGKKIAFYEVCIECGGSERSKNLEFLPPFCIQKGEELKEIFKKLGLKNYGEGSPILKTLER